MLKILKRQYTVRETYKLMLNFLSIKTEDYSPGSRGNINYRIPLKTGAYDCQIRIKTVRLIIIHQFDSYEVFLSIIDRS